MSDKQWWCCLSDHKTKGSFWLFVCKSATTQIQNSSLHSKGVFLFKFWAVHPHPQPISKDPGSQSGFKLKCKSVCLTLGNKTNSYPPPAQNTPNLAFLGAKTANADISQNNEVKVPLGMYPVYLFQKVGIQEKTHNTAYISQKRCWESLNVPVCC